MKSLAYVDFHFKALTESGFSRLWQAEEHPKPTGIASGGLMSLCLFGLLHCLPPAAWAGANQWTSMGPEGGSISTLIVDPTNPNTLYAGTQQAGVFKSLDGGNRWNPANTGLPMTEKVNAIAIDPIHPSVLYAATAYGGVFKSINAGKGWTPINSGLPSTPNVSSIVIDPSNPAILYLGISGVSAAPSTGRLVLGVFKSTDGGRSWNPVNTGLPTYSYVSASSGSDLTIDPFNPATLYVNASFYGTFKSTNGGANWNLLTNLDFSRLLIDPSNPATLYATRSWDGVYKSINGGVSWNPINAGLPSGSVDALSINPSNPATLYAEAGGKLYKTDNGGGNWVLLFGNDATNLILSKLIVNPSNPATLYAARIATPGLNPNCGGILKSTNAGANWSPSNAGLTALPVSSLAIHPSNSAMLYAGTGCGVFKSINAGINWNLSNTGMTQSSGMIVIDPSNPAILYSGTFKSTNGGESWTALPIPNQYPNFAVQLIDASNPALLYGTITANYPNQGSVVKSIDGGQNWNLATTGLTGAFPVTALIQDPSNPLTLYAGGGTFKGYNGGIYKTTDGGGNWSKIINGLTPYPDTGGYFASTLLIDPTNPVTVYAGASNGPYKSTDGGGTWNISNTGLAGTSISQLIIDPTSPTTLYAGSSQSGVYKSSDAGNSWSPFSNGLTASQIRKLLIDPGNPKNLYAATNGGLFKYTKTPESSAECLFEWAEKHYPSLFAPAGSASAFWNAYTFRHYPTTQTILAVSSADNHLYFQGPDGKLQDQGPLTDWLPKSGCMIPPPPVECLFTEAENAYPSLFAPAGTTTTYWENYFYRYYPATQSTIATSILDQRLLYQGPDGQRQDVGPLSEWLPKVGCQ